MTAAKEARLRLHQQKRLLFDAVARHLWLLLFLHCDDRLDSSMYLCVYETWMLQLSGIFEKWHQKFRHTDYYSMILISEDTTVDFANLKETFESVPSTTSTIETI